MFRKGGPTNEGIVSMAQPRKKYAVDGIVSNESPTEILRKKYPGMADTIKTGEGRAALISAFAGQGRSQNDKLSDLLIKGGLETMSARPDGNIFSTLAKSYKKPVDDYLKESQAEDSFQRQARLQGVTSAIGSEDARRLAMLKAQGDQKYLRENEEIRALEIVANNKLKEDKDGYLNKSQPYALSQAILERLATRYIPKGFIKDENLIKAIGLRDKSGTMVIMKNMEETAEGFFKAPAPRNTAAIKTNSKYRNNATYLNPDNDLLYIFDNGFFKPYPGIKPLREYLSGK